MRIISLSSLLAIAAPLASAFTLSAPTNPTSGEITEIHWGFTAADPPTFSLFLMNSTQAFDLKAIIGENLQTNLGQITTLWPVLPAGDDYQLRAVNVTNVDFVLAFSPAMSKGAWAFGPFFTATAQFLPLHNYAQNTGMRSAYWLVPWGTVYGYAAFRGARAQPVAFATSTVMAS
ncbi:hypothetical protein FB451DRAFT_1509083 [Mycena latifolia]|nr:hypothetical protein FB451DRAFT_1509083 [Mycena latifolia]